VNGTAFFIANEGLSGAELWKTDGTELGTVRVKDIRPGAEGASLRYLTNVGGVLYFSANDGINGPELWKSDGTEKGTTPVRYAGNLPIIVPSGITGSQPIASIDDRLYVVGSLPEFGTELFTQVLIDPPAITGDYDRNGVVNQADYDVWFADFGSATRLRADGNGDGVVDAADYVIWRSVFKEPVRIAPTPPRRAPFTPTTTMNPHSRIDTSAALSSQQDSFGATNRTESLLLTARDAAFAELANDEVEPPLRAKHRPAPRAQLPNLKWRLQ
jgi:ELWxxDGT repeat protein